MISKVFSNLVHSVISNQDQNCFTSPAGKHQTAGYKRKDIVRTNNRHSPIIFHVKASLLSWISFTLIGLSKTKVWAVKLWKTVLGPSVWVLFLNMEEYHPFKEKETKQKIPGSLLLPMSSPGASDRSQEQQDDALVSNTQAQDDCTPGNLKLCCLKN